jgi:alkanesulfonate monooxygenase SsuD/methylene tetrahydromethanopterin reductase-like flavin-dependent oxidoreductase (luciferase family)
MAKIQFGWSLPNGAREPEQRATYLADVERGLDLVRGHYDSAWMTDHLMFEDADRLEGWTTLTYFAARQPAFAFGHAVLCQSFRNPALLAKMGATLQFLSGGRFILGIGAGWHEPEYTAYGYEYPPAGLRVEELDETVRIVKALWTEKQATVEGTHYQVQAAYCEPKPDPLPPIMIGGSKPRMLRLIARHADWWNVSWTGIARYREEAAEMDRACADVGRDPATLRRTWFGGCTCGPSEAEVARLNGGRMSADNAFVGTPAQLIAQMQPFIDLGVDYFMLSCGGFPDLTTLHLLRDEVLPALNRGA